MKFIWILALSLLSTGLFAQQANTDEGEKKMRETIDAQIENYTKLFDLEGWQVFYLDSILTHDYAALVTEINELNSAKVSNRSIYETVQDKWAEQIYNSVHSVFNDTQWAKYLKSGAAREKKARDKRMAKRDK